MCAVLYYHPHFTDEDTEAQEVSHDHTAPKRSRLQSESASVLWGSMIKFAKAKGSLKRRC